MNTLPRDSQQMFLHKWQQSFPRISQRHKNSPTIEAAVVIHHLTISLFLIDFYINYFYFIYLFAYLAWSETFSAQGWSSLFSPLHLQFSSSRSSWTLWPADPLLCSAAHRNKHSPDSKPCWHLGENHGMLLCCDWRLSQLANITKDDLMHVTLGCRRSLTNPTSAIICNQNKTNEWKRREVMRVWQNNTALDILAYLTLTLIAKFRFYSRNCVFLRQL